MATLIILLTILGSLGVFLFGMKVMSEALQKVAGEKMRGIMAAMTRNRFVGVGSGTLITALIQSSTATTVMVVSFVNARLLTLREAISVIMGANIGTTFTFFIISYAGIKFSMASIALPLIGIGLPMILWKSPKLRDSGEVLIGVGLLFQGLELLKTAVPEVQEGSWLLDVISSMSGMGYGSLFLFMCFGVILTIIVQSSTVAGAITIMMAYKGWIDYNTAAAIILGENIGTTITANIAAIGGSANAKRAARAHFVLNIIGVCWIFFLLPYFVEVIAWINPNKADPYQAISVNLAWFHFSYNIINVGLLIWFIPLIEKIVIRLVPGDKPDAPKTSLVYISPHSLKTGELDLIEAQLEVVRLAELSANMFKGFLDIYSSPGQDMSEQVVKVREQEVLSDKIAFDLTNHLIHCSTRQLSENTAAEVVSLTRIVSELEDICDWCKRLANQADKRFRKNRMLPDQSDQEVIAYGELVLQFLQFFRTRLNTKISPADIEQAAMLERQIDNSLKTLRKKTIRLMSSSGEIKAGVLHIDILSQIEKIGNHALNILQAMRKSTS